MSLADVWYVLLGLVLLLALALDGFDLGIGILSLFSRDESRRGAMLNSIGPVWHANLTWLVVLGGLLFGAFPLAYGVILSALYIPLMIMLLGLIFRGVSLDFRQEAQSQLPWNLACGLGSLAAALAQGFIAGSVVSGFKMQGQVFAGGVWDWLNPLAALVALGVLCGYLLLGAAYLILKTEGEVQATAYLQAQAAAWSLLVVALGLGCWGFFRHPFWARGWLVWPTLGLTAVPILLAAWSFVLLISSLLRGKEKSPFVWSLALFGFAYLAMAASLYPYVIPPTVTAVEAASPPATLAVMLAVTVVILPVMLLYNGYQYLVFRGKAGGESYGAFEDNKKG